MKAQLMGFMLNSTVSHHDLLAMPKKYAASFVADVMSCTAILGTSQAACVQARTDLYAGRTPLNEVGQLALSDSLQALMHLRWVHLSLHMECQPLSPGSH